MVSQRLTLLAVSLCAQVATSARTAVEFVGEHAKEVQTAGVADIRDRCNGTGPYVQAEINIIRCRSLHESGLAITEGGALSEEAAQLRSLEVLMEALHPRTDQTLDMENIMQLFKQASVIFEVPFVKEATWEYAWRHSISNIMDHPRMHFILHTAASPHVPEDPSKGVHTFSGWPTEGGAFVDERQCKLDHACTVHINLRDLQTDLDEFVSNLLLHWLFLTQQQQLKEANGSAIPVHACHDSLTRTSSCRGRGKCWLSLKPPGDCKGSVSVTKRVPGYSVEVMGMNEDKHLDTLVEHWSKWAEKLKSEAIKVSGCDAGSLRAHVVQGATEAVWVMTSKFAMRDHGLPADLEGRYGGKFEEQDRLYARLMRAMKSNWTLSDNLNAENGKRHAYVQMTDHYSVATELVNMEAWAAGEVDPVVTDALLKKSAKSRKCSVMLSVGYAFGTSALPMGLALKKTFGASLKSFYAVAKAGGLVGKVGDYQVPHSFVHWRDIEHPSEDKIFRIKAEVDTSLWSGGGNREVHQGALLTVPSVVLQNNALLETARRPPVGAAGLEMESYYFQKALAGTPGLYLYYTSDLPQAADSSLAHEQFPWQEGQTLFNGLVRMTFVHMLGLMEDSSSTRAVAAAWGIVAPFAVLLVTSRLA